MAPVSELLADARLKVGEVSPLEIDNEPDKRILIDVRERPEFEEGYITGAIHISKGFLEVKIEELVPKKDTPITLYCGSGVRSLLGGRALVEMGYTNVKSLRGGFGAWKQSGREYVIPKGLSESQKRRYGRHLLIPEVGEEGQQKLLGAKVLLIGVGGLGSPAALYLAAAGVGTIGLLDFDVVDESNLQRQVIHTLGRVGMKKTESARKAIAELNSDVVVVEHNEMLNSDNAREIFEQYDIVVNGCDNFPTRYLANDMAIWTNKPLVDGGIFRFEGQVTTVVGGVTGCYRCRYPQPPPPEEAPSCAEAGVLGVLPGIVGCLQAIEVIKLIVGIGATLAGRLLYFDALEMRFSEYQIQRDPLCPVCGENPTITKPIDYEGFCSLGV